MSQFIDFAPTCPWASCLGKGPMQRGDIKFSLMTQNGHGTCFRCGMPVDYHFVWTAGMVKLIADLPDDDMDDLLHGSEEDDG